MKKDLKMHEAMKQKDFPILSVVIPTLGRPIILQTMQSLIATEQFENIEVLVAGKISDTKVRRAFKTLIEKHRNIRHFSVKFERGDSSEKKNVGWHEARSDVIAFLDDDVVVATDWPAQMLKAFDDPAVGGCTGPSLVPPDVNWFAHLAGVALQSKAAGYVSERYLKGERPGIHRVGWSHTIGCNMAYRRFVLEKINGFERDFWPGEEMLAAYRAGLDNTLMFNPDAWVYHYPRVSFRKFWKQMHGYGATRIRLIRAGVEFEPTTVVPALWVMSVLLLLILLLFFPSSWPLLVLDLVIYLLADTWITIKKYRETKRLFDLCIFFLIPFMHIGYGWAEWVELFRPDKDLSEKDK